MKVTTSISLDIEDMTEMNDFLKEHSEFKNVSDFVNKATKKYINDAKGV